MIKPHGVRGSVKLKLHNPTSTILAHCTEVILAQHQRQRVVQVEQASPAARGVWLFKLAGVSDMEAAQQLRGAAVLVERDAMGPMDAEEYLYEDLVGCQVMDEHGDCVGQVHQVFEAGASDVLVVRQGQQERMVPLIERWVPSVDLDQRTIQVRDLQSWEPYNVK